MRLRFELAVPSFYVNEIKKQASYEPALLACGALALPYLRQFDASDLLERDGIHVKALFSAPLGKPDIAIVIPFLGIGGAEKFTADLVDVLMSSKHESILIVVTDQTEETAGAWRLLAILKPFTKCSILFLRDAGIGSHSNPTLLARYLNALRPRIICITNSRIGLDAVSRFGKGLSAFSCIYCTFFSMGNDGIGAPYGTRFPRKIAEYSHFLTDNRPMESTLRTLTSGQEGKGVHLVPPRIFAISEGEFQRRLINNAKTRINRIRTSRWLWISRLEPFKGTEILAKLAEIRPKEEFHLFGPQQGPPSELGLLAQNIYLHPSLPDIAKARLDDYDGFIFTSLFEGMPQIVLEMSQHGLPMVLADVGGLRETFSDDSVIFIASGKTVEQAAKAYSTALDRLSTMSPKETEQMATAAYREAVKRHNPESHLKAVNHAFGVNPN